jgi:aspartyl-tRNA(Asn)/glutamyl-tRNA(Gln) amidotransferase subunit A
MASRRTFTAGLLASAAGAAFAPADDPAWLGVEQAADLLRRRKLSPVELTQACLRRIEQLNPKLNAFITVTGAQALAQARVLEAELAAGRRRGPLHGIPIALKDLIDTAGVRTTSGSEQHAGRVPAEDAEVARRLKAAGAVLLGKANMDEFAYNFTSETSFFGASRNPWDPTRSPGGSSGGSAIAVASGMCLAALGSDTGGSIRLPAALCGITGLKPSYGRVSTRGVTPLAWSLDHVGPMCRSARDAAFLLEAMSGRPVTPAARSDVRLGVPRSIFFEGLDPQVERAIDDALKALGRLGASVRDVVLPELAPFPQWPGLPLAYARIISAEAFAFHEPMLRDSPERYHAGTRRSIENGAAVTAAQYIGARREMERLRADTARAFPQVDLLITPSAPAPAFELGKPASLVFLRNSAPWNLYGLPSISVPCGFSREGLPIGLQITGPPGADGAVLSLAEAFQRATDWHTRRPRGLQ